MSRRDSTSQIVHVHLVWRMHQILLNSGGVGFLTANERRLDREVNQYGIPIGAPLLTSAEVM